MQVDIEKLLDQSLNVHDILRYFPEIEADPESALHLSKAVAMDLQKKVQRLESDLQQAGHSLTFDGS